MISLKQYLSSPSWGLNSILEHLSTDLLLRNSVFIMGTTALTSLLGFVYWTIATHTYSAHDVGLTSALIAAMTLTSNLANLGLGSTLIEQLSKRASGREWSSTFNTAFTAGIVISLGTGLLVGMMLPLVSNQFIILKQNLAFEITFVLGVSLWTISTLLDDTFIAERKSGAMLVRNVVFAGLKIPLLVLPLLLSASNALGIFSSWVFATLVAILAGGVLVSQLGRGYYFVLGNVARQMRVMLSSLVGHHLINIGGVAPMYLLPVFVATRLSATDNAYFYTSWMVSGLFFMISPAVASSLFAEGSYAAQDLFQKARSSALIIGALLGPAMLIFLLGGRYILAVFGPGYPEHGVMLLTLLIISAVPDAITSVYVSVLRVQGRLRTATALNLSMAIFALCLAWILLPLVGIAGAGWAWLIAQSGGSLVVGVDSLFLKKQTFKAVQVVLKSKKI